MNNAKFRNDIARYIAKSKKAQDMFVQKVVLEIDKRLVQKSPVGDINGGRFRNNWNISNAFPDLSTTEAIAPNINQSRSAASIFSIKANGQIIYLTNSLPYAYRIEYEGWSKTKAPAGVVRVTIAEMASILQGAAFETKASV
jgi:hypothetical protein